MPAPGVSERLAARRAGVARWSMATIVKTLIGRDDCDVSIPGVRAGVRAGVRTANCAVFAAPGVFIPAFELPTFVGDVTLCLALGLLFQALGVRARCSRRAS